MPLVRGPIVSLLFAVFWLALIWHSRPELADIGPGPKQQAAQAELFETWSFSPALLKADERAAYENEKEADRSAALARAEALVPRRAVRAALFTLLGLAGFWAGVWLITKKSPAGALLLPLPALPCLVTMTTAGFLISGPPLCAGVVIAAITLVSQRLQPAPTAAR